MEHRFCSVKTVPSYATRLHAVSSKGKTWDVGSTINIVFLNGSKKEHRVFRRAVYDILDYANLKVTFDEVSQRNSDIRVRFFPRNGNWSYIGTDALLIPSHQPTISIANVDYGTCLHEACHALGAFKHEHQNPALDIEWNEEVVIKDLSGPPNNWDIGTIRRNVLDKIAKGSVLNTKYDPKSVMLYYFPDSWVKNGKGTKNNNKLSDLDKAHLKRIYPSSDKEAVKSFFWSKLRNLFRI